MAAASPSQPDQNEELEKAKSFENALHELEDIVGQLEGGAKPLDESLGLYEKGVNSLRHCHTILDKAEKRIRLLVKNSKGEPEVSDSPIPDRKSSSRRTAPVHETPNPAQGAKVSEITPPDVGSKKSGQQPIDCEPLPRQNTEPSVKPKSRPVSDQADAGGGSLFGSAQ